MPRRKLLSAGNNQKYAGLGFFQILERWHKRKTNMRGSEKKPKEVYAKFFPDESSRFGESLQPNLMLKTTPSGQKAKK